MNSGILERIEEQLSEVLLKMDTFLAALENVTAQLDSEAKPNKTAGKSKKAEPVVEDEDEDEDEQPAPPTKKKVTTSKPAPALKKKKIELVEVKNALKKILDKQGRESALSVLSDFDVQKVSELQEKQFEAFLQACEKYLANSDDSDEEDDE